MTTETPTPPEEETVDKPKIITTRRALTALLVLVAVAVFAWVAAAVWVPANSSQATVPAIEEPHPHADPVTAPEPEPKPVSYDCVKLRGDALWLVVTYPSVTIPYSGSQQDACQLNEVIAQVPRP